MIDWCWIFLEGQARWEADSPHHLMMLHEMFWHTLEQGQKEAECVVCWGCWHGLLKLDPEVDISAVQLVWPQTSRKEIKSLYYEVYKLQRLLGSPPGEPELTAEVVFSLEDHQGWDRSKTPQMMKEANLADVWPQGAGPLGEGRDASVDRSLTEAREAHQKALAMAATLEEEIEWLSCPLTRSWSEAWAHSQSRDCHRCRSRGWMRRYHQVWPEDCHAPCFEYCPSWRSLESEGDVAATEDLNLEEPLELGLEVTCFLQGSAKSSEEENEKVPSPKPPNRRVAEVGDLEGSSIWNTQLVAGANHGTWGGWLWKAGTWGMGLFLTPKEGKWTTLGGEWPLGSTCTTVSLLEEFPATARFYLCLLRYLGNPAWEDSGICPGPSVLGRED